MAKLKKIDDFDVSKEVECLKIQTKAIRKRNYYKSKSKLDPYHGEIISLMKSGATNAEIHRWLFCLKVEVAFSTITRWKKRNFHRG